VSAIAFAVIAFAAIAVACSVYPGRVRTDHARQFGCEERWVAVTDRGDGAYRATGCGFVSEWRCRDRECRMRDQRAFCVDAP
jgi:hypothetical protein